MNLHLVLQKDGEYLVVELNGTRISPSLALCHIKDVPSIRTDSKWQIVDIPTGLYICAGKSKRECLERFKNTYEARYDEFLIKHKDTYERYAKKLQDLMENHDE